MSAARRRYPPALLVDGDRAGRLIKRLVPGLHPLAAARLVVQPSVLETKA